MQDPTEPLPSFRDPSDIVSLLVKPYRRPRWFVVATLDPAVRHLVSREGQLACSPATVPAGELQTRSPRETDACHVCGAARKHGLGADFEDPAPPWVADLAHELAKHAARLPEIERWIGIGESAAMLAWCHSGEPRSRASSILAVLDLWPGAAKLEGARLFVETSKSVKAGRRSGRPKFPRHVYVSADWDEVDARKATRLECRSAYDVARMIVADLQAIPEVKLQGNPATAVEWIARRIAAFVGMERP